MKKVVSENTTIRQVTPDVQLPKAKITIEYEDGVKHEIDADSYILLARKEGPFEPGEQENEDAEKYSISMTKHGNAFHIAQMIVEAGDKINQEIPGIMVAALDEVKANSRREHPDFPNIEDLLDKLLSGKANGKVIAINLGELLRGGKE